MKIIYKKKLSSGPELHVRTATVAKEAKGKQAHVQINEKQSTIPTLIWQLAFLNCCFVADHMLLSCL
jgi:hypothetical protein